MLCDKHSRQPARQPQQCSAQYYERPPEPAARGADCSLLNVRPRTVTASPETARRAARRKAARALALSFDSFMLTSHPERPQPLPQDIREALDPVLHHVRAMAHVLAWALLGPSDVELSPTTQAVPSGSPILRPTVVRTYAGSLATLACWLSAHGLPHAHLCRIRVRLGDGHGQAARARSWALV